MKNLIITVVIITLLLAAGCKRDLLDCEVNHWGTLRLLNSSSQDVRVYVDGNFVADVLYNTTVEVSNVPAGFRSVHAEQLSLGQVWDNDVLIEECQRLNLAFTP